MWHWLEKNQKLAKENQKTVIGSDRATPEEAEISQEILQERKV